MEIISRKEARDAGLKWYFTGKPCKHGHVSVRDVATAKCQECCREYGKIWREKNPDRLSIHRQTYWTNHRERLIQKRKLWEEKNPQYRKEWKSRSPDYRRQFYLRNKEYISEKQREYNRRERASVNARTAARRARKAKATPNWLSEEDHRNMRAAYQMATRLSSCMGVPHHVDHLIPLQGKTVCGLHVPWNLAVIPARVNQSKNNKLLENIFE